MFNLTISVFQGPKFILIGSKPSVQDPKEFNIYLWTCSILPSLVIGREQNLVFQQFLNLISD